ncbi:hypothetical protein LJK88_34840 [Paenibacillus sp. P26]|nr:hypothetical protein LJK88_34840 [Paenibacillus sp. P26]
MAPGAIDRAGDFGRRSFGCIFAEGIDFDGLPPSAAALNAVERAVFLLREIFNYSFDEIAEMVGKTSANCRQIFHRAKKSIHFDPVDNPSVSVAEEKVRDFVNSLLQGNTTKLLELVSENVVFYGDGGGKVRAAQVPVAGFDPVIRLHLNLLKMYEGKFTASFVRVNGLPGLHFILDDGLQYVYSFAFRGIKSMPSMPWPIRKSRGIYNRQSIFILLFFPRIGNNEEG